MPSKWAIIVFIIFFLLVLWFLPRTNWEMVQCETRPVIPDSQFMSNYCRLPSPFLFLIGAEIRYTFIGYLTIILFLIVIPYLLACLINYLIKKK